MYDAAWFARADADGVHFSAATRAKEARTVYLRGWQMCGNLKSGVGTAVSFLEADLRKRVAWPAPGLRRAAERTDLHTAVEVLCPAFRSTARAAESRGL